MRKIVFTEEFCQPERLFPFTLTRHIQDIRVGILTIREKWELALGLASFDKKQGDFKDHANSIDIDVSIGKDLIYLIHGNILPSKKLVRQVKKLKKGEFISLTEKESVVYCISGEEVEDINKIKVKKSIDYKDEVNEVRFPWDIFLLNNWAIREDIESLKGLHKKQKISSTNKVIGKNEVFVEKGAVMEHCFINASEGPVFIGRNALVMEGTMIRGPVAICEGAVIKMGTRIYGATTIGPFSTVGGEIKNSVLFANSNKAHDGYLGDSVIGEWCNMGAGTSNSNVKNTGSTVSVWTPAGSVDVGLKCGVFMGDYSRTAINTSINTGTVIGVCSHIAGTGLTPKYIPSFSWGSEGVERYRFEKALEDIQNWKRMKKRTLGEKEVNILKHIFEHY